MNLEETLREKLIYNPDTGDLIWTDKAHWSVRGKKVGCNSHGYLIFKITAEGRINRLNVHRVAWFLHYGEWPPKGLDIDHANGDRADNRIRNLRLATRSQNMANARQKRNSSSPYKGVSYEPKASRANPWRTRIKLDGKQKHIGSYATAEEAHEAYKAAAIKRSGQFARAS